MRENLSNCRFCGRLVSGIHFLFCLFCILPSSLWAASNKRFPEKKNMKNNLASSSSFLLLFWPLTGLWNSLLLSLYERRRRRNKRRYRASKIYLTVGNKFPHFPCFLSPSVVGRSRVWACTRQRDKFLYLHTLSEKWRGGAHFFTFVENTHPLLSCFFKQIAKMENCYEIVISPTCSIFSHNLS